MGVSDKYRKWVQLSGERAKLDAKANGTYVVYKDASGRMTKEHFDGKVEVLSEGKSQHD